MLLVILLITFTLATVRSSLGIFVRVSSQPLNFLCLFMWCLTLILAYIENKTLCEVASVVNIFLNVLLILLTIQKNKNGSFIKDAEYGLDSRYKSNKEYKSEATSLMEARLNRMKNLSKEQIVQAKLMQLKLKINILLILLTKK